MPQSMNTAISLSGLAVLVTTLTFATPVQVGAQLSRRPNIPTVPVDVTNTPLPVVLEGVTTVDGTVAVTRLPTVHVGTLPPVGIDPLSNTVQVSNSVNNPVLVRNVDTAVEDDVVSTSANARFEDGSVFAQATFLRVPLGKRLVVEHLSGQAFLPAGDVVRQWLVTSFSPDNVGRVADVIAPQVTGVETPVFNHQTRLYFGPGETVAFSIIRSSSIGLTSAFVTLNGYFVAVAQ